MTSSAPQAPKRPTTLTKHGDNRTDEWYWLREKSDPEVIALLEAENEHLKAYLEGTGALQEELFEEFRSRIQETDLSVPVRKHGWWYYSRTEEGRQYGISCRKADVDGKPAEEEIVLLDQNEVAGDAEFFSLGAFSVAPTGERLAYSTDLSGSETFTLRVRDLNTMTDLEDVIEDVYYGATFNRDGSVLFYTRQDEAKRPYQVWRHVIGTPAAEDVKVFQEDDERFFVGVGGSKTEDYLLIVTSSSLTSETWILPAGDPTGEFQVVEPRRQGVEYHLSHYKDAERDEFYVTTNEDSPNFRLMVTPAATPGREHWQEVIAHRPDVKLDGVEPMAGYLIMSERAEGTARLALYELATGTHSVMEQPETVYTAGAGGNAEFDTHVVRYSYTSMVTPRSVYEYDVRTGERTLLKQQPVLGGYDPTAYTTERVWAKAADGVDVPVSLVYRADRAKDGGPAVLYGYGAYEMSTDPYFSSFRLSLLDRGFVFAIAHIRGGGDLGRLWYEDGKFEKKPNTFSDFVAAAEHLVAEGYTSPQTLIARGGSAGGLLMGAVTNLRPDLFAGVIAEVPFVDTLTTMLDPSLPLTVHEYEEWGNPEEEKFYNVIKSYSPYDNVVPAAYPAMLVTAGLNDPRVSYWEPAKWVQRLREANTGPNQIVMKIEMGAGHGGPSGRYDAWKDEAMVYAWILERALKKG
ncbi:oligopeptidase B [Kineosporia sp. NBRC 101677]|uniref:S9 family peptidase n=1 Tax=Kineosporia sp. NBRC 101677 TaxID=3032197 RepID=UPI0024A3C835|nr:S9 family peptidase [Kineosporia sp. NBRC 101677]GLY18938.1 oligopeptidase B [Kineosporia sp. NBRC 101677]